MAESVIEISSSEDEDVQEIPSTESKTMDCPVCLQTCVHPARLPCGHIFCFLCVKGTAYKNKRCALCRRDIPIEFLDHPQLVHGFENQNLAPTEDGQQWFYEGRNGWWQYDERTSQEIEESFKKEEKTCKISVAGNVYLVDFDTMYQMRQDIPTRRRKIKRDFANIPKKGVAGLNIGSTEFPEETSIVVTEIPTASVTSTPPITTLAATDIAVRLASDIIDSSLVHLNSSQSEASDNVIVENIFMDNNSSSSNRASFSGANNDDILSQTLNSLRNLHLSDSDDDFNNIL